MKKTVLFVALCLLVSCQPTTKYIDSYEYIVKYDFVNSYGVYDEAHAIYDELCEAVGCQPTVFSTPTPAPQDEAKKTACSNVVKKNEELGKNSIYLRYLLIRQFVKMAPPTTYTLDTLAVYEMGDAMFSPYAFYKYTNNHKEAWNAVKEPLAGQEETDYYKECAKSYLLLWQDFHNFMDTQDPETGAAAITARPWRDNEDMRNFIKEGCDIIADNYSDSPYPVSLTYTVNKIPFPGPGEPSVLWQKTFEGNKE